MSIKKTRNEESLYNVLKLYADDDGEILEDISSETLGKLAGIGEKDRSSNVRIVLLNLEKKGYIIYRRHVGVKLKEIKIIK